MEVPCESDPDIEHTYVLELLNTICTSGLDFAPPAEERTLEDETPIVVVLHGLTGGASRLTPRRRTSVRCRAHSDAAGSHESYVRSVLAPVCTPVEQGGLGYRGIVVNFRGCERSSFFHFLKLLPHVPVHIVLLSYPQRSPLITSELPRRCRSANYQPAVLLGPQYRRPQNGRHVYRKAIPPRAAHRRRLLARGQCPYALLSPGRLQQPARSWLRIRLRESADLVLVSLDPPLSFLVCLRTGCIHLAVGPRRLQ